MMRDGEDQGKKAWTQVEGKKAGSSAIERTSIRKVDFDWSPKPLGRGGKGGQPLFGQEKSTGMRNFRAGIPSKKRKPEKPRGKKKEIGRGVVGPIKQHE